MSAIPGHDDDETGRLLTATAGGDRHAFEALYRQTSPKLFGVCLRMIPQRAEAEEVLQDVFTLIWHKAGQFDPARARGLTWLAMIARNKAIDHLRANAPQRRNVTLDDAGELRAGDASPLERTERASTRRRIDHCLAELEPPRSELIRTAFFDGITYEELAARTDTPIGTVKSWIRRGLAKLKACLER
ncbi:RNA polymerase sigma-70 factor (ECF subfamily) [Xanthomonas sp. 3272]|uniref:sigma-70 family RNA polymerase sigma factor n=1 Tax=Xanthomonas arboricola TaxID=56448 RepID=UPI001430F8B8|nr:sigma-70 family RNA polymerase sigma factor [Xanthomonas arboricola]NJC02380.1 RNA polymerase sigma-70 factor (ECF subfamily) [Xanthomonas arboricola]